METLIETPNSESPKPSAVMKSYKAGEVVSDPIQALAWVQEIENQSRVRVCGRCGAFDPEIENQLLMGAGLSLDENQSKFPKIDLFEEASASSAGKGDSVFCSQGCGRWFCSSECEKEEQKLGAHHKLCVGPLHEDHPLVHLRFMAMSSGAYETIMLSAHVAVALGNKPPERQFLDLWNQKLKPEGAVPFWWDVVPQDLLLDSEELENYKTSLDDVTNQTWQLLSKGLSSSAKLMSGFELKHWARLLTVVATQSVTVKCQSPLSSYISCLASESDAVRAALTPKLVSFARTAIQAKIEADRASGADGDADDDGADGYAGSAEDVSAESHANEQIFSFSDLFGRCLLSSSGSEVNTQEALCGADAVAIYFVARWCAPCRIFTTKLSHAVAATTASGRCLKVVIASSDSDLKSFEANFTEMPSDWLAIPFIREGEIVENLENMYKVRGVPELVVIDGCGGQPLTTSGRALIDRDPNCSHLPWLKRGISDQSSDTSVSDDDATFLSDIDLEKDSELPDDRLMAKILVEPSLFVAPPLSAVLLLPLSIDSHSCAPTCELKIIQKPERRDGNDGAAEDSRGLWTAFVSRRTLRPGEYLTISFLEDSSSADYNERGASLELRGVSRCSCTRCCHDRFSEHIDAASDSEIKFDCDLSVTDIKGLVEAAELDSRYSDALALLKTWLSIEPNNPEALYQQSRAHGWSDQLSLAYRLLMDASLRHPDNMNIAKSKSQKCSYHSGPCCTTSSENDENMSNEETMTFAAASVPYFLGKGDASVFSHEGVFSVGECRQVITEAERHVTASGGWTTSRHYSVPTTDIALHTVPRILSWFNGALRTKIFPLVGAQFGVHPSRLRVVDSFLVKYDARLQRSLPLHCDQSRFSLTIAMNSRNEYDGGGTFFWENGEVVNCDVGGVISFDGSLLHSGYPISRGLRYIIVVFLYVAAGPAVEIGCDKKKLPPQKISDMLLDRGHQTLATAILENNIDGSDLCDLSLDDIRSMGLHETDYSVVLELIYG